jgi:hypothetical protein
MGEGQPDYMTVTVTVKVTPEQRAAYAAEYQPAGGVADDMTGRLQAAVQAALYTSPESYWVREYTTFSVSEPA